MCGLGVEEGAVELIRTWNTRSGMERRRLKRQLVRTVLELNRIVLALWGHGVWVDVIPLGKGTKHGIRERRRGETTLHVDKLTSTG